MSKQAFLNFLAEETIKLKEAGLFNPLGCHVAKTRS
jgi:hypothetical protein